MSRYKEIDLSRVRTCSAEDRSSKFNVEQQGNQLKAGISFREFLNSLPRVFKANDLLGIAQTIINAREKGKPVIAMLGGHVIKTGCSPFLAHLATQGFISHFASNGATAIHETELALFGHTSEHVKSHLEKGSFGMAHDTALMVNLAAKRAFERGEGFGEALGALLIEENPPYLHRALSVRCYQLGIPHTIHIAIGTDVVHQHPTADGAAIGESSLRDFRILAETVSKIGDGGVVLNIGSAVIMPEVFLKCLAVARNLDTNLHDFTTANFDMIQHYRPGVNVLKRPISLGGVSFSFTGHHEIMIPLLAATVYETAG
jgi:hypothetical protein